MQKAYGNNTSGALTIAINAFGLDCELQLNPAFTDDQNAMTVITQKLFEIAQTKQKTETNALEQSEKTADGKRLLCLLINDMLVNGELGTEYQNCKPKYNF
jgi:hypothetical protein